MTRKLYTFISIIFISAIIAPLACVSTTHAAETGQIMFLLDASSSMLYTDGGQTTRIDRAKSALKDALKTLPSDAQVGLRVYGSQIDETAPQESACQDSVMLSAPKINNSASLASALDSIHAKGWTLLGKALQDTASDFTSEGPKSVILLSDGIDTCGTPDPCEVAKNLESRGVKVKINTLGMLVDDTARAQLKCIAENSGGSYYDINDLTNLRSTLGSLAQREVSLFTLKGLPVKGSLRPESAPPLLSDTNYTDTAQLPQELYYAFEALPNQEISFTVTTTSRGSLFENAKQNFKLVGNVLDAKTLQSLQVYSDEEFINSAGNISTLEIGPIKTNALVKGINISKPTKILYKVSVQPHGLLEDTSFNGAPLAYEIKVSTKGGDAPSNKTITDNTKKNASTTSSTENIFSSSFVIGSIVLTVVILIAILGFLSRRIFDKRKVQTTRPYTDNNEPDSHDGENHS